MKIEMGESLFYSWLRHVKECQIVQTNWKASPQWVLEHEDDLQHLMDRCSAYFEQKLGYKIFKKNSSLSQILQQGEIDAVGISIQGQSIHTYTVDVAFHESGLNYGTKDDTVAKVIAKSVRSAMLLYGYMNSKDADIIFASPKITPALLKEILPCIDDLNSILEEDCFKSRVRILANEDFNNLVLQPILLLSDGIADTSELFLRSYQMYTMFTDDPQKRVRRQALGMRRSVQPIPLQTILHTEN